MARISDKNARYRSKAELVRDLAFVLNSDLKYGTKYAVLHEITWVWTEFFGKHKGCPWRSKASLEVEKYADLIHEHVIPRKIIISHLIGYVGELTEAYVDEYLETHCIGVLVTKEEDQRLRDAKLGSAMPDDWDGVNVWARYQAVSIIPLRVDSAHQR